jgi:ABC-2 type transport system permease protein
MTAVPVAVSGDADTHPAMAPGAGMRATATAVAARTLRKYMRSPQLLVTSIVSGAIFIVLFRYIFGGAIDFGSVPYVDFLIPGMVLTSVLITGTGTAVGVAEDRDQGFFDRLRSLPAPRIALLAGRALGDIVIVAWGTAVTAAMGFLVGFRLHGSAGEALLAFALCVICGFAFLWLFICMGLVSANAQAAQGTSMVIYPSSSSPAPMCRSTPCPAGCNPSPNTSPSPSCPTRCAR